METRWGTILNKTLSTNDWKQIYKRKIANVVCKRLSEFNYKLIHNLIYTGYIPSKWKVSISNKCVVCGETDTVKHPLFDCKRVKCIWEKAGESLKLDITWSHIILGLDEIYAKEINQSRNNIISIISCSIYATWVKCGDTKESFKYQNLTVV